MLERLNNWQNHRFTVVGDNNHDARAEQIEELSRILDAYFEGLEANDASNVPLAHDVILENPQTRMDGEPLRGRREVTNFLETAAENMPRIDIERHVIEGRDVCTLLEWESADGVAVPTVDHFEIEDGAISRIRIYLDLSASDLLAE